MTTFKSLNFTTTFLGILVFYRKIDFVLPHLAYIYFRTPVDDVTAGDVIAAVTFKHTPNFYFYQVAVDVANYLSITPFNNNVDSFVS